VTHDFHSRALGYASVAHVLIAGSTHVMKQKRWESCPLTRFSPGCRSPIIDPHQKLLCCNAFISVVKAAELWNCDNLSERQHLSSRRTLLAKAQVGSRSVVVAEIKR
jgi:hypothetical protein